MKNKISKVTIIMLINLIVLLNFNIKVYADAQEAPQGGQLEQGGVSTILEQGENFINKGEAGTSGNGEIIDVNKLKRVNTEIFNILVTLGVVAAVIIGSILGIQLMWGSIEQQVKAKEMLFAYGIGCVVVFGAFGIWKICIEIFSVL